MSSQTPYGMTKQFAKQHVGPKEMSMSIKIIIVQINKNIQVYQAGVILL